MKIYKILALFILLLVPVLVIALDTVTVSTQNIVALPNSTNVLIPLSMNSNDSVSILEFTINYPAFATFKGVKTTQRMINATVEYNQLNSTSSRVAAFTETNISAGSGTLMYMIFDINSSATAENYSIYLSNLTLTNIDIGTLSSSVSGSILQVL